MRRTLSIVLAWLVVAAAGAATLYMWRPDLFHPESVATAPVTKSEYYCPMHPQQKSDKPDNCPICSMKMVKLEKAEPAEHKHDEAPTVFLSPERQQLIGVKTAIAEYRALSKDIRSAGKIAVDETRITHIHTKVSGFVEEVFADFVGKPVRRGEALFTLYSPDLVATQEEYLLALRSNQSLKDSALPWVAAGSSNLLEAARKRLQLWDISEREIRELETSGKPKRALTIYSPVDGIITQRAAYHHGKNVNPEMDLFTIVDLSTVWVLGQVYEHELSLIQIGQQVQVEFPNGSGMRPRTGQVSFIAPTLDPKTRTAEVRVALSNSDMRLRPDMFVDFTSHVNLGSALVVPTDAVLDTGTERYVFVDKGQGNFEPRSVTVGQEADGYTAIARGLRPGERVATAANFILDSESRLKGALPGMATPAAEASQALQVEILEPKAAKTGVNRIRLMVKDAQSNAISDAEIQLHLYMPPMGAMASMRSTATLKPLGDGQFSGEVDIPMAWTWETTVTAKRSGQTIGTARTSITAR